MNASRERVLSAPPRRRSPLNASANAATDLDCPLRAPVVAGKTDLDRAVESLYQDGVTGLKGAFNPAWADRMREDIEVAYAEAKTRPGGAVGRGPNRYYVEIHPQAFRGFVELVSHPWLIEVCKAVLGPDYQVVEVGFDIPFAGAMDQPWHRDFPAPQELLRKRRINSLAFNLTAVDTEADMGPFEIAPGTHWEPGLEFKHGMFPAECEWPRYASLGQKKLPKRGDLSARSALTIHRGTANHSQKSRPVLVLGVDAPGAGHAELHDLQVTSDYYGGLPPLVRQHLHCRIVKKLEPITQKHQIEGLVTGV
ncbi:MAG TPA: phytanoyl-CoA dioxygenase family protein [Myxococcales bacterium]|jgi:hypothetical protein